MSARPRIRSLIFALLCLFLLSRPTESRIQDTSVVVTPQQREQQTAIKVQTTLVMIPAVVTDHTGKCVEDLTIDDFHVRRDGQIQKIALFKHVKTNSELMKEPELPPDSTTNTVESGTQRLTILVLDFVNSSFNEQRNARRDLLKFLSKSLDTTEPVSLLALEPSGVKVIHDFTTNPSVLKAALETVTEHPSSKEKPDSNPLDDTYRSVTGWNSRSDNRNIAMEQARVKALGEMRNAQASSRAEPVAETLEALREIGEAFAGIPGRKSMVWATGGFPFEIDDAHTFGMRDRGLLPAYERAWRALNQANIAVYPLDLEDLVGSSYVGPGIGRPLPQHVHAESTVSNLEKFADATGGKLCDRREDAGSCFRRAANDSSDYYLLGIYENSGDTKPGWKKLTVKVGRPDLQVRARSGYYVAPIRNDEQRNQEEIELALSSPFNYTALKLGVRWSVGKPVNADGKKQVDFMFSLPPGTALLEESNTNQLSLEFAALAKDAKGAPAGTFSKVIEGHLPPSMADNIKQSGVRFPGTMNLEVGEFTITFMVRDEFTGKIGTVSAVVKVP